MPHRIRPAVSRNHPLHVTLRVVDGAPSLRSRRAWAVIVRALRAARGRFGLDVVHYAVLGNHMHLLVEARAHTSVERGLRGLVTRLAKQLNASFARRGRLFRDRYHARGLTTPLEVRRGLAYVLLNHRKHAAERGERLAASWIDPRSTGITFAGWRTPLRSAHRPADFGTQAARTWLLRVGWRRHGAIAVDEVPGRRLRYVQDKG